jgi:hypothetical protein
MSVLEQVPRSPRWRAGLEVALTRPAGVPERRGGEDPWKSVAMNRPGRIVDDLAWLRRVLEEEDESGLSPLSDDDLGSRLWEVGDEMAEKRLFRLRDRGVLSAAGFELHRADAPLAAG